MKNPFFLITGLVVLFLISCEEDYDVFIPDAPLEEVNPDVEGIARFFKEAAPPATSFNLDAESGTTIRSAKGSLFKIPAMAFVDESGASVFGTIQIDLKEVCNKGAMILHNAPTQTLYQPLESSGAFHLSAWKNNQQLELAPDSKIECLLPVQVYRSDMELFYGNYQEETGVVWIEANDGETQENPIVATEFFDSLSGEWLAAYAFHIKQLNWINCDAFMTLNDPVSMQVSLPAPYTNTQAAVFLAFQKLNAVLKMNWNTATNSFVSPRLPAGEEATIIVVATQAGEEEGYYFVQEGTMVAEKTIELTPEATDIGAIQEFLSGL